MRRRRRREEFFIPCEFSLRSKRPDKWVIRQSPRHKIRETEGEKKYSHIYIFWGETGQNFCTFLKLISLSTFIFREKTHPGKLRPISAAINTQSESAVCEREREEERRIRNRRVADYQSATPQLPQRFPRYKLSTLAELIYLVYRGRESLRVRGDIFPTFYTPPTTNPFFRARTENSSSGRNGRHFSIYLARPARTPRSSTVARYRLRRVRRFPL